VTNLYKERTSEAYLNWVRNLKPGDTVCYNTGHSWGTLRKVTTVKKRTPSGRIRLEDATQWYAYGRGQGDLRYRYLQSYTAEMQMEDAHAKAARFLNNFDFSKLKGEDILKVLQAVKFYASED
jgi:hypothetical protein